MQVLLIRDISRTYLGQIIRILAIEFIHGEGIIFCKKAYNMLLFIKPGQAHYSVGGDFLLILFATNVLEFDTLHTCK